MEAGMTLVYTTDKDYRINIMQAVLDDNGIESNIISKHDSSYVFIGEFELYVSAEDYEKAKELVNSAEL